MRALQAEHFLQVPLCVDWFNTLYLLNIPTRKRTNGVMSGECGGHTSWLVTISQNTLLQGLHGMLSGIQSCRTLLQMVIQFLFACHLSEK
jgi:hypothetical protein